MDLSVTQLPPIKSALFVDFDNIYIGLSKTDPQAAERFASDPSRWLAWLEKGLPKPEGSPPGLDRPRSVLIRRCYPNPDAGFRRYRSFFTSAAFSVIDCPSLTRTGKNSADIYMVMDILDTLNHRTTFDEFIVFSGDSDFMPVLLRLRAYDRRTTTLAIDFMPPAYKAACDLVISEEDFIEEALGISSEGNCAGSGMGRARVSVAVLKEMSARVFNAACDGREVAGADLPDILKDFREFRESNNWLGFGTSQRLAEALICSEPRLQLVRLNPMMYKIVLKAQPMITEPPLVSYPLIPAEKPFSPERERPSAAGHGGQNREKDRSAENARLRSQVVAIVKALAAGSSGPILLARASQHVMSKLGPQVLESQWAGSGSFKRLLQSVDDLGLEITTQPEPGYLFDPARHAHPAAERERAPGKPGLEHETAGAQPNQQVALDAGENLYPAEAGQEPFAEEEEEQENGFSESLPSLEEFTRRVSQVTGAPDLTPHQYALVFHGIVNELQQIAEGQKVYNTYSSSEAVSDWCAEQGETISRSTVVLVFKGIIFQDGIRFGKHPGSYTALELASVVRSNIQALCRRARMELSEYEEHLLDEWIMGELEDAPEPGNPVNAGYSGSQDGALSSGDGGPGAENPVQ